MLESEIATQAKPSDQNSIALANGGFAPDTELLTPKGPLPIHELSVGDRVYALNRTTRIAKPKPLVDVQEVEPTGDCVRVETRRANLCVAPDHRFLYRIHDDTDPQFAPATELLSRWGGKFVNDWRIPPQSPIDHVDCTDFLTEYEVYALFDSHGHTVRSNLPEGCEPRRRGRKGEYYFDASTFERYRDHIEATAEEVLIHDGPNCWRRPYFFDGDDFLELLAWFVTEGSVTWSQSSDTAHIRIAQKDDRYRESITDVLDRLGFGYSESPSGFEFSSSLYGRLFERLCGTDSKSKRLPSLVWEASTDQKTAFLSTLIDGDGNDMGVFYTSSDQLAADVLRLAFELGIKPQYYRRKDMWRISTNTVNDGFKLEHNVELVDSPDCLYQLTMADFSAVMAGRQGKLQWVGVSNVQ